MGAQGEGWRAAFWCYVSVRKATKRNPAKEAHVERATSIINLLGSVPRTTSKEKRKGPTRHECSSTKGEDPV